MASAGLAMVTAVVALGVWAYCNECVPHIDSHFNGPLGRKAGSESSAHRMDDDLYGDLGDMYQEPGDRQEEEDAFMGNDQQVNQPLLARSA